MAKGKTKTAVLFLIFFIFLAGLGAAFAREDRPLEVDYPDIPGAITPISTKTILPDYIKYIFNFSIIIAGLIAFAALIQGGFCYLTSKGDPAKTKDCRSRMLAAFLGLIVLLSSYLILNIINPQLVILSLPLVKDVDVEAPVIPSPTDSPTLNAVEIPLGRLIDGTGKDLAGGSLTSPLYEYEGVLAKTRMERIIKLFEENWNLSTKVHQVSEEISEASENLKNLILDCRCSRCNTNCGGCDACPCDCSGDPCPRAAIIAQQNILIKKADELEELRNDLISSKEKIELEREKLIGALSELGRANKEIKNCFFSVSPAGRGNILLDYYSFQSYKENLEKSELGLIEEISVDNPWLPPVIGIGDPATFYCTEGYIDISLSKITISEILEFAELPESDEETEGLGMVCKTEMPIGYALLNATDISKRLIEEMAKTIEELNVIINEIPDEVANARFMATLPRDCDDCRDWCGCACSAVICCDEDGCWCCGCEVSMSCSGDPCPGEKAAAVNRNNLIQANHSVVTSAYNKITASNDEIHNLIEGPERIPTWADNIIEKELPLIRNNFMNCVSYEIDLTINSPMACETAKTSLEENRLDRKTSLEKQLDDCPNTDQLTAVKEQLSLCGTGDFYLSDLDVCKGKIFCCDQFNYFCCQTD